jgi:hypothetical protein
MSEGLGPFLRPIPFLNLVESSVRGFRHVLETMKQWTSFRAAPFGVREKTAYLHDRSQGFQRAGNALILG